MVRPMVRPHVLLQDASAPMSKAAKSASTGSCTTPCRADGESSTPGTTCTTKNGGRNQMANSANERAATIDAAAQLMIHAPCSPIGGSGLATLRVLTPEGDDKAAATQVATTAG